MMPNHSQMHKLRKCDSPHTDSWVYLISCTLVLYPGSRWTLRFSLVPRLSVDAQVQSCTQALGGRSGSVLYPGSRWTLRFSLVPRLSVDAQAQACTQALGGRSGSGLYPGSRWTLRLRLVPRLSVGVYPSHVPRLSVDARAQVCTQALGGRRKEEHGIHCLCMHLISQKSGVISLQPLMS